MVRFYADLHLHSRYSLATSRDADLEHLALWARKKGLSLLATGDFTHPAWLREIKDKLVPAEPGLFRLRPDLERELDARLGQGAGTPIRFLLEVEISTIYKKAERTRKVHHLVYVPSLQAADALVARLERIGNLASDGRPILGLDSRDLLEITLQCDDGAYLVPAHIWTPWFAVLGSKSGFDSVEECYGDLAGHIFAVETGLSSDPPMNWRLRALDRYTLVSNSDAHSPPRLGREACVFDTELDYFALRRALETGEGFGGTVEFFPDEGKYHLDGHRKCGVRFQPRETREHHGRCPACGKPVTVGVMHRVELLADRPVGELPERTDPFSCLLSLPEVLAELEGVGSQSQRVKNAYEVLISRLGGELQLLRELPLEEVGRQSALLAEALGRMRAGEVRCQGGYDGEYGVIRLFGEDELRRTARTAFLFEDLVDGLFGGGDSNDGGPEAAAAPGIADATPDPERLRGFGGEPATARLSSATETAARQRGLFEDTGAGHFLAALDPEQRAAALVVEGPLLILAGPGTGKTRTLTHRLAHLVGELGVPPDACLTITFTRRAACELRERLDGLLGVRARSIPVLTFHALGYRIVLEHALLLGLPERLRVGDEATAVRVLQNCLGLEPLAARRRLEALSRSSRRGGPDPESSPSAEARDLELYRAALHQQGQVDLDELLELPVRLLEEHPEIAAGYRTRFQFLSVDETQDIDALQYRLVRLLCGAPGAAGAPGAPAVNLCAIGDPDQSIYGFRGADPKLFERFRDDFPGLQTVRLLRNYRSERTIVDAALQVISHSSSERERGLVAQRDGRSRIAVHAARSVEAEAEWVVHRLEQLLGGHSFYSLDSGRAEGEAEGHYGFSDFAVLYRIEAQADALAEALERSGMPYQRRSHRRHAGRELVQWLESLGPWPAGSEGTPPGTLRRRLEALLEQLPQTERPRALGRGDWLLELADQSHEDMTQLFAQLAVGVEVDSWDPRADRISLLTLHAAKGLEFPVVFLVGCEDGLLPLRLPGGRVAGIEPDLEEERRLFFVGMTRAKERLFLSRVEERTLFGRPQQLRPSPFLADIEQRLLEVLERDRRGRRRPRDRQLRLL